MRDIDVFWDMFLPSLAGGYCGRGLDMANRKICA